jgi:hypothetical protein
MRRVAASSSRYRDSEIALAWLYDCLKVYGLAVELGEVDNNVFTLALGHPRTGIGLGCRFSWPLCTYLFRPGFIFIGNFAQVGFLFCAVARHDHGLLHGL